MQVAVGMFILMVLLVISVYLFIRTFTRYGSLLNTQESFEGYSISNNLPFEKFNYWFRTVPLFSLDRPLPANPLPINVRLF